MINRNTHEDMIDELRRITNEYTLSSLSDKITILESELKNFDIKVLVVGHFSAGKSALLNTIINKGEILTEDQSPQTAVPAELNWSENESLQIYYNDGKIETCPISQPPVNEKIDHFKYCLNSSYLKELQDFTIVDTPGFDAGIERHNKALSAYIGYGSCYVLVISIEKGTIDSSTIDFINELSGYSKRFAVLLNKTDKLTPENVNKIYELVNIGLQHKGIYSSIVTISKYDTDAADKLTKEISSFNAQTVFDNKSCQLVGAVAKDILILLESMFNKLDSAYSFDHNNEIEKLHEEEDNLKRTLATNIIKQKNSIPQIINNIQSQVEKALINSSDTIAKALSKGNTQAAEAIILETIRPVIILNLKESSCECIDSILVNVNADDYESDNQISEMTLNLIQNLKNNIQDGSFGKIDSEKDYSAKTKYRVATGLFAATTNILSPIFEVVLILAPDIIRFVKSLFGISAEQQAKENFINQMIPQIRSQLYSPLNESLKKSQASIAEYMEVEINNKIKAIEESIHHIEEMKAEEINALEKRKNKLSSEIERVKEIINNLEA